MLYSDKTGSSSAGFQVENLNLLSHKGTYKKEIVYIQSYVPMGSVLILVMIIGYL